MTLEGYAGALMSMSSFLEHCKELCTEDILRRLAGIGEVAVNCMTHLPNIIKQVNYFYSLLFSSHFQPPPPFVPLFVPPFAYLLCNPQYGSQLKAATAMVRLRLYTCLLHIPAKQFEGAFANLLRQIGRIIVVLVFLNTSSHSQYSRPFSSPK